MDLFSWFYKTIISIMLRVENQLHQVQDTSFMYKIDEGCCCQYPARFWRWSWLPTCRLMVGMIQTGLAIVFTTDRENKTYFFPRLNFTYRKTANKRIVLLPFYQWRALLISETVVRTIAMCMRHIMKLFFGRNRARPSATAVLTSARCIYKPSQGGFAGVSSIL